jgi:HKD family nuclease
MEVAGTISNYLESEEKYDHMFWTSFSMDPITIEFLFKNDLIPCLNRPYFHFICDKAKLDETVEASLGDPKKINRLSQMQAYLLLSHQKVEGAFHPKIIFFSSIDRLKCIILSGNATSSGILSNQDLVAKFEWSSSGTNEYQKEIASVFQFLSSFTGWVQESRDELDSIASTHPGLAETRSENVFYSDGNLPLLNQIVDRLPIAWDIHRIIIFSPFVDPQLNAITKIAASFPSSQVIFFYPGDMVEVNNPGAVLPENLSIQSSSELGKSRFHAKYFAFIGKENAYALWGSANCSYSALLSPNRNKEILIGYKIKPSEILDLWPGLNEKTHNPVKLIQLSKEKSAKQVNDIELLSGSIGEGLIELITDQEFDNRELMFFLFDGEELPAGRVSTKNRKLAVSIKDTQKICGAYLCDNGGKRISNALFLNNFLKIRRNIEGAEKAPSYDQLKEDQKKLVNRLGSDFFLVDTKKLKPSWQDGNSSSSDAFAFWHMPHYSRQQASIGIFGHERFVCQYVTQQKDKRDLDGEDKDDTRGERHEGNHLTSDLSELIILRKQAKRIRDLLYSIREKKLEKMVPFDRWLRGEEYMLRFFMETVQECHLLEERDIENIRYFLRDFLRIVFYTLTKLQIGDHEDGLEFVKSLNMMSSLYLLLAKYSWSRMSIEKGTLSTIEGYDKCAEELTDAALMIISAERCLEEHGLDRRYEARTVLLEDVSKCLRHGKAAHEALAFTIPGLKHVDMPDFEVNDLVVLNGEIYVFKRRKDNKYLEFSDMMGNSRSFSKEYVQPRKICGFMYLTGSHT